MRLRKRDVSTLVIQSFVFLLRVSSIREVPELSCSGDAKINIDWPHPGLIQPLMILRIGVRASVSGLKSGRAYHAYLHLLPDQERSHYQEFTWNEHLDGLTFNLPHQLADGPMQLRLQVFSSEGCLEGVAWVNGTIRRDMGLTMPTCSECVFTTGWASEHFEHWDVFLSSSNEFPPLPASPDVLEVGFERCT
jgi:hypothetical protein